MLGRLYNTAKSMCGFRLYSNPVQLPVSAPVDGWVSYICSITNMERNAIYHLVPLK